MQYVQAKFTLKLDKPASIGICILEYNYIKNKYDNKSKLLLTYIDSWMYEIKTEDVKDFSSDKETFDFSNYSIMSK